RPVPDNAAVILACPWIDWRQAEVSQTLSQAPSVDELHAVVRPAVVLTDFVDRYDVRVVEIGSRLRLQAKPLPLGKRGRLPREDHLQRDDTAAGAALPGPIHDAHGALGDLFQLFVVAERTVANVRCRRIRRLTQRRQSGSKPG